MKRGKEKKIKERKKIKEECCKEYGLDVGSCLKMILVTFVHSCVLAWSYSKACSEDFHKP